MNLDKFKKKIVEWNNYIETSYVKNYGVSKIHIHLSPIISSLGYPPTSFKNWLNHTGINIPNLLKEIFKIPIVILYYCFLFITLKYYKKIFSSRLQHSNSNFIQSQHEISAHPRKSIEEIKGLNVMNDLNLSFFEFKTRNRLLDLDNYICSLSFVSCAVFLKCVIQSIRFLIIDLIKAPRLFSNEHRCYRRILTDYLKIVSFQALVRLAPKKHYIIFWENRGWQNYLGEIYSKEIILIQLGYEGYVGPTYVNYRFMKKQIHCKIFFNTLFAKKTSHRFPNNYLMTLPSSFEDFNIEGINHHSDVSKNMEIFLLLSNYENSDENFKLLVNLVLSNENLFIRPHPENDLSIAFSLPKNKIENRSISEFIDDYTSFLFMGTTTISLYLASRGASCSRLIKPDEINIDASSNFIYEEMQITNLNKLSSVNTTLNKSPSWISREIIGPLGVISIFELNNNIN